MLKLVINRNYGGFSLPKSVTRELKRKHEETEEEKEPMGFHFNREEA